MDRRRSASVVCHDGFMYKTSRNVNNIRYLVCTSNRQLGCTASAKITGAGDAAQFTLINPHHNHPIQDNQAEAIQFKNQLREACITERGDLENIYDSIAVRNPNGAIAVPYNSVMSSMLRWIQATTPTIPESSVELAGILQSEQWQRYSNCMNGRFFAGIVSANGHHAVIFGNPEFIGYFAESEMAFIDGTFKVVPKRPSFEQILSIFAISMDHAFPVIHIFMEKRTKVLYDVVFNFISQNFPKFMNRNIVTDFEVDLVESLRSSFPHATLRGCLSHYCQAVFRKAKSLGIVRQIDGNENGRILLRKYYALAFLPPEMIAPTLRSLQHGEHENTFRGLREYIEEQWIGRVTPQHFSVFRQRHLINNVMESYRRRLNSKLARNSDVWALIEVLIDVQNTAFIELGQLERGNKVFRVTKKKIIFDERLNEAWYKLSNRRLTVEEFLLQAVQFVAGLDAQLVARNRHIREDEEEPVLATLAPVQAQDLPPPLAPSVPVPPHPRQPVLNQPPPLLHFRLSPPAANQHDVIPDPNNPSPSPRVNPSSPPLLAPLVPVPPQPLQPVLNEPPPLLYFRFPPSAPNQPAILPAHNTPSPPVNSPSPLVNPPSPPINFPSPLGALSAQLGDEAPIVQVVVHRWVPAIASTEFDEETMPAVVQCKVCMINLVQYCMECGHVFCSTCADRLFNVENPKCGICHTACNREPTPLLLI